jgi:hypothetical protein
MKEGSGPDPYIVLIDMDLDPGGPKTYGSGSATLDIIVFSYSSRGLEIRIHPRTGSGPWFKKNLN